MRAFLVMLSLSCFACGDATPASSQSPDDGDASVGSTCPPLTGAGTTHDAVGAADETWTAAASPHLVATSLAIPGGRTITIEPCAVVRLGQAYRIGAESTGSSASLTVAGPSVPLLTIDAGVTLRFAKGARLHIDGTGNVANGALRIADTTDRPVVLTSADRSQLAAALAE